MKRINQKGSTILSGVFVLMVILIVMSTSFVIASSYYERALCEYTRKQAYLNALSVADVISGYIYQGEQDFIPTSYEHKITISQDDITLPQDFLGQVEVEIVLQKDHLLYIQVLSTYEKSQEEVQLVMQEYKGCWYKKSYSQIGDEKSV